MYEKNYLGLVSNLILHGTTDQSYPDAPEMRDSSNDLPDFSAAVSVICTIIRLWDGKTNPYSLPHPKISITPKSFAFIFSKVFKDLFYN